MTDRSDVTSQLTVNLKVSFVDIAHTPSLRYWGLGSKLFGNICTLQFFFIDLESDINNDDTQCIFAFIIYLTLLSSQKESKWEVHIANSSLFNKM